MLHKNKITATRASMPFSEADAARIIESTATTTTGRRILISDQIISSLSLAEDLNRAYSSYLGWQDGWDQLPTSRQFDKQLRDAIVRTNKVQRTYEDLAIYLLRIAQVHPSQLVLTTEELLNETIDNLDIIQHNLILLKQTGRDDRVMGLSRDGKKAKAHFTGRLLPEIYSKHFGRPISRSTTPDGKPCGPMVRFVAACLKHLDIKATDESIVASRRN